MSKEYIEREAVVKSLEECAFEQNSYRRTIMLGISETLKHWKAADVAEVVRCKNCRFWDNGRCESPTNGLVVEYTTDNDFCSYGKRKETYEKQD